MFLSSYLSNAEFLWQKCALKISTSLMLTNLSKNRWLCLSLVISLCISYQRH